MQCKKISISLPIDTMNFVDRYQKLTGYNSRSKVITEAIELLRLKELEQAYREASLEYEPIWETTTMDGLNDETW